jgi:hypothetical protein
MSKIRVVNLVPKMHKKLRCDGDGLKIKNEFEKYVTIILKKNTPLGYKFRHLELLDSK